MLSRNLYQGCHYHGLRRQNICKSGEILLWKQSRSVFDEKPEALWVGGTGIPGGLHTDAPGFGVEMLIFRSFRDAASLLEIGHFVCFIHITSFSFTDIGQC